MTVQNKSGNLTLDPLNLPILLSNTLSLSVPNQTHKWRFHEYPHTCHWNGRSNRLAVQGIHHHIRFTQMLKDLAVIILDYVQPPVVPHVQVRLIHNMSQNLVIRVDSTPDPIKVMPINLEGENHRP